MIRRGTYILVVSLGSGLEAEVGSLGTIRLPPGEYVYVGSAMGGLDQRVSRHLRKEKTMRWHIDRLTSVADSVDAYVSYPDPVPECELAAMAEGCGMEPSAKGFGCSDCSCATHLFKADGASIARLVEAAGLVSFSLISFPGTEPL